MPSGGANPQRRSRNNQSNPTNSNPPDPSSSSSNPRPGNSLFGTTTGNNRGNNSDNNSDQTTIVDGKVIWELISPTGSGKLGLESILGIGSPEHIRDWAERFLNSMSAESPIYQFSMQFTEDQRRIIERATKEVNVRKVKRAGWAANVKRWIFWRGGGRKWVVKHGG